MAYQRCARVADMELESVCEVVVGGRTIALARDEEGGFHALDNVCAHLGGPLGRGYVDGDRLVCPLHSWEYQLADGSCLMLPGFCLPRFAVRVEGDDILVDVPDLPAPEPATTRPEVLHRD
jgi:nitrite reductase (NADH) small subunit